MIRATTPKHIFYFETDPSIYSRILITYQQNGSTILEKTKEDLTIEETTAPCDVEKTVYAAWFRLTQEETNKFQAGAGKQVTVQVRVLTTVNEALASDKKTFSVQDVLNDEVLV